MTIVTSSPKSTSYQGKSMVKVKVIIEYKNGQKTEQTFGGLMFNLVAMQIFSTYRSLDYKTVHRMVLENIA